jgi:hypothetical protein
MTIQARLKRLERSRGAMNCGPGCPPLRWVDENDFYDEPSEPPAPCPRCGRPPIVIPVIYDPDFYGNADRLAALKDGG